MAFEKLRGSMKKTGAPANRAVCDFSDKRTDRLGRAHVLLGAESRTAAVE
jgi:hypothetical protein